MTTQISGSSDFSEQIILDQYPFPIAYLFANRVLRNTSDAEKRVRGIYQTFENSLRYLATLVLAEYAQYPEQDEALNELIEDLTRPSIGDLQKFVREGVKRLNKLGHQWFMDELPYFVRSIEGARGLPTARGRQSLVDSLLYLRNRLSHREYEPDWATLLKDYHPLLLNYLRYVHFLAHYPLCRFVKARDGASWVIAEMMGHQEMFPEKPSQRLGQTGNDFSGIYLSSQRKEGILPLHPFVIVHNCQSCMQQPELSGISEELFLLNGVDAENTVFIGVRHELHLNDQAFSSFCQNKQRQLSRLDINDATLGIVNERARRVTHPFLEAQLRHGIYIPQAYQSRLSIDTELEKFFANDHTAFLLLGESGIGKTNLLCHWADQLFQRNIPTLYYPAAELNLSTLGDLILSDLALNCSLKDLLSFMQESKKPLVLMVDGLNEHSQLSTALRQLNDFISQHSNQNLKVIFSLRTSHFRQTLEGLVDTRIDPEGKTFFSSAIYHTALINGASGARETYQQVLTKIDAESSELEEMYGKYRNLGKSPDYTRAWKFSPLTAFSGLSKQVRDLISNPWYLRLILEAYHESEVPSRILSTDLLKEYCQRMIYYREDTADLVEKLVDFMCQRNTASLTRSQLNVEPTLKPFLMATAYEPSPYSRLVEDGVIVELPETASRGLFVTPVYRVQFAFDRVLEFLIASWILSRGQPRLEVIRLLSSGINDFVPFAGALQVIWSLSAEEDNGALILESIESCDNSIFYPLVSTLRELEAHSSPAYDHILNTLSQDGSFKAGYILLLLGDGMSIENGIEAQTRIFEIIYNWNGEMQEGLHFVAGKELIFGYVMSGLEAKAAEVYNQLQRMYSQETQQSPDLLRFTGKLLPDQRKRILDFAWVIGECGLSILARGLGHSTLNDEMLSRLKLEWLSIQTKHELGSLINLLARVEAMTSTEAALKAAEQMADAEKSGRMKTGLRAFDNVGLNLSVIIQEQLPKTLKEVEAELGFICKTDQLVFAAFADRASSEQRDVLETTIRAYISDRQDVTPYIGGKLGDYGVLVGINLILADGYKGQGNYEKQIEFLLRAESYASAWESSRMVLNVYNQLRKAFQEYGSLSSAAHYADLYLAYDVYLDLLESTKAVFFKEDPFDLLIKSFGVESEKSEEWRELLKDRWFDPLLERCSAWLTDEEKEAVEAIKDTSLSAADWENYLSQRVFNYKKLRTEQRIIEVIKLLCYMEEDNAAKPEYKDFSMAELVEGRLLLIAMRSKFYKIDELHESQTSPLDNEYDHAEYSHILKDLRDKWLISSIDERLRGAAAAAIFPAFKTFMQLERDEAFCSAIGKQSGTDAAASWLRSVIRCWYSDIRKGRRGDQTLRDCLEAVSTNQLSMSTAPELVLTMLALLLFWAKLKEELNQDFIQRLSDLSASSDNLETMVEEFRQKLKTVNISANQIVSEIKDDLIKEHQFLEAEFQS